MTPNARKPETRVAVFAKAPVAGHVKTRLVPALGETGAARLHAALLRRALTTAAAAGLGPVQLWCAPDENHPFLVHAAREFGATLHRQQGADLGERMGHAFETAHAAGDRLVLIGSDCPALEPADLRSAAAALEQYDAAIAPAEDGGYVLVALARPAAIFGGIEWGSGAVMAQTRRHLEAAGIRWKELPTLWDVDRPEDYARLQAAGDLRLEPRR